MTALVLQITDAGRAAMVDAVGGGTRQVRIAAAGLTAQAFVSAPTLEVLPGEFKRIDAVSGQAVAADTVHLTLRDSGTDSYAVRGFGLYLRMARCLPSMARPIRSWKRQRPPHSTWRSIGNWPPPMPPRSPLAIPPLPIRPPPRPCAVAELASLAEALAGAVADKIITPATLAKVLAGYVNAAQLGAPGGVAMLGADGKLAVDQRRRST
jgi:hypothetical protein